MAQMNLATRKKLMDMENRLVVDKREREEGGWTGNRGVIEAKYCIWSG